MALKCQTKCNINLLLNDIFGIIFKQVNMPMWRNWQTHMTQNHAGNHVGSSPTIGTKAPFKGAFLFVIFEKMAKSW